MRNILDYGDWLEKLVQEGKVNCYDLHDPGAKNEAWRAITLNWANLLKVPSEAVRRYFGTEVALYFVWMEEYIVVLSFLWFSKFAHTFDALGTPRGCWLLERWAFSFGSFGQKRKTWTTTSQTFSSPFLLCCGPSHSWLTGSERPLKLRTNGVQSKLS